MKKISAFIVTVIFLTAYCPANQGGVYRWDYKILIDPDGVTLFSASASPSTIHALVNIPRPAKAEMHNARADAEKQKVTVTGYVVMDGQEADGDYHLVVTNTSGDSLISEIPDPGQPKLNGFPGLKTKYTAARSFVEQNIDPHPGGIKPCPNGKVKVTITGIVFFDKVAHGSGHAPNGVEIHPVLNIVPAH